MDGLGAALSWTCAVLGHCLGSPFFGRHLARQLNLRTADGWAAWALAGAWALSSTVLAIGLFASVNGRFDDGLMAAGAMGLATAAVGFGLRSRGAPWPRPVRSPTGALLAAAGSVTVHAWVAVHYQLHNEDHLFGHFSIVSQLAHGNFPPWFPPFPEYEAQFHYGFDLIAAAWVRSFGLSLDAAIDLTTTGLVALLTVSAAAVVVEMSEPKWAAHGILAVHFGAGLAFIALAGQDKLHPCCLAQHPHPTCGVPLFPPPFLNLHQHPMAAAAGLACTYALVVGRLAWSSYRRDFVPAAVAVGFLGGLGLMQVIFHILAALASAAAALVAFFIGQRRRALLVLGVAVAGHVVARCLGGMFMDHPEIDASLLGVRPVWGWPEDSDIMGRLRTLILNLGLGFVLLPLFSLWVFRRRDPLLGFWFVFSGVGVLVPQVYVYARAPNIQQFAMVSAFGLALLTAGLVTPSLSYKGPVGRGVQRLFMVLLLGGGLTTASFMVFPLKGGLRLFDDRFPSPTVELQHLSRWLHAREGHREVVLASVPTARALARSGGASVLATDGHLYSLGIRRFFTLRKDIRTLYETLDPHLLMVWKVHWIVLTEKEISGLGAAAQNRLLAPSSDLEKAKTPEGAKRWDGYHVWRVRRAAE